MNARYRIWQFWQAVWAQPLVAEAWDAVSVVLTAAELNLFCQFSRSDQRHSYRVMDLIREAGYTEPSLLKAALLHDVGKVKYPIHIWNRVVMVLGTKLLPQKARQWGLAEAGGWQRPFVIKACHPQWGAEMAEAAGSDPLTITLIRYHQDNHYRDDDKVGQLLRILQWADDQA